MMRAGQNTSLNSNAIPSQKLGANMLDRFQLAEAENVKGSFLVNARDIASDRIASCALFTTKAGRDMYLLNSESLTLRSGIPAPNEAPNASNKEYWIAYFRMINYFHPNGLPASVVAEDGEVSIRFPEQVDARKLRLQVDASDAALDDLLLSDEEVAEESTEPESDDSEPEDSDSDPSADGEDIPF